MEKESAAHKTKSDKIRNLLDNGATYAVKSMIEASKTMGYLKTMKVNQDSYLNYMLSVQTNLDKAQFAELPHLVSELQEKCSSELKPPQVLKMKPKVLRESDIHPALREAKLFGLRKRGDWRKIDSFCTDPMSSSFLTSQNPMEKHQTNDFLMMSKQSS